MLALGWLESLPAITAIRTTPTLYAAINALHILGLGLLIGGIVSADLRVLGLWRREGWRDGTAAGSPVAGMGLAIAIVTGVVLFAVRPGHYLGNLPFLLKLVLLCIGLLNVAIFHSWLGRTSTDKPGLVLRMSSGLSIVIWIAAIFSGRFIAYV